MNQYEDPCYKCCFNCIHAINMDCSLVCESVAEYYHPEDEE
ncbi:hypothetical protein [Anaerophilus nitritogenes]|nr:hypothetical protein [Anaerophilus nitritogenes]